MNGYGTHTYTFWNDQSERFWVKFHFKTLQGHGTAPTRRPQQVIGKTRESYQEDLYGTIERGDFPKWTMFIQVMPEKPTPRRRRYNPFDLTKVWPHGDYPLIEVGVLELNRNPDNYFAEVEQAAFIAVEHRSRHRLLARQDAAGPHLLLCRRASLPARHALRGAAGEPAASARCTTTTRTARCASSACNHQPGRLLRAEFASTARPRTRAYAEPPHR